MNKKKWSLFTLFLTAIIVAMVGLFAGCKKGGEQGENNTPVTYDKGNYYYLASDDSVYPFTLGESDFVLETAAGKISGTYTFDGKGSFQLSATSDLKLSAKIDDGVLSVIIGDATYVCTKGNVHLVSYETDNGASLSKYAVEGGKAFKPQDPVKEGKVFAGWYEDDAFTMLYDFTVKTVTKPTTIYARYVAEIENIFTVRFAGADEEIPARQANKGGVLVDLPKLAEKEGKAFLGWWMSDYEEADKLTCEYKGQVLTQNVTLYAVWQSAAPMISVDKNGVSWTNMGVNVNYRVSVTPADGGASVTATERGTKWDYDFESQLPAGEYVVEVSANGQTGTAYYKNKTLSRVSIFEVDGFLLHFNTVENVRKYYVTVECANDEHGHVETYTNFDNGNSTLFDFEVCDMRAEGIRFTVRAEGDGYLSSTSEAFVFERSLGGVQNITLDASNETFSWDKVENAQYYLFQIGDNAPVQVHGETSVSVKEYAGNIKVSVTPVAHGYNSPAAAEYTYAKERLATPKQSSVVVSGNEVSWEPVDGALKYRVQIGNSMFERSGETFILPDEFNETYVMEITVTALSSDPSKNSLPTEAKKIARWLTGQVTYSAGSVQWASVVGATKYLVQVNDGRIREFGVTTSSYAVTLSQKGENVIRVGYYDANGLQSNWEEVTVEAYEITLQNNDRFNTTYDKIYRAVGDPMNLPSESVLQSGYTFSHWSARRTGSAYIKSVFDTPEDLTLYAQWIANLYGVTFDHTGGTMSENTTQVYYGTDDFEFPVAQPNNTAQAFAGWFSGAGGGGVQYTDSQGKAVTAWDRALDETILYAYWVEAFSFNSIENDTEYSVSKGPGINYLSEITIPQTYEGKPVTTIEGAAFYSCKTLKVVNVYDTIKLIVTGNSGGNSQGSAFYACDNLERVNVLPTDSAEKFFASDEYGVLLRKNKEDRWELAYVPHALATEVYTIPDQVEILPIKVFYGVKLKEITVPATVTTISEEAFYGVSTLEKVKFLAAADGVEEKPLSLGKFAFRSCSNLTEITLPSRLGAFDDGVFEYCSKLEKIFIDGKGGTFSSTDDGLLLTDNGRTLFYCPRYRSGTYDSIPSSVMTIGSQAFTKCSRLEKIVIPGSVELIKEGAFRDCTGLIEIEFTGVKSDPELTIEKAAFYGCKNSKLTSIVLPENLVSIGEFAFGGCTSLKSVTVNSYKITDFKTAAFGTEAAIPEFTVTGVSLGAGVPEFDIAGVFGEKLISVTVDENNQNLADVNGVLYDKNIERILFYPSAKDGAFALPDTVKTIGDGVFKARYGLTAITLPASLQTIGAEAFANCTGLGSVTFDGTSTLLSIGDRAFAGCTSLEEFEIPNTVTTFGLYEVPESKTNEVQFRVFDQCSNLERLTVAAGSTNFATLDGVLYKLAEGEYSELMICPIKNYGNEGVVDIPKTVTAIWYRAFYGNAGIREVKFSQGSDNNVSVGTDVFNNCTALEEVTLPKGTTVISTNMFRNCSLLETITIPNTVTTIQASPFTGCSSLSTIIFEEGGEEELTLETVNSNTVLSGYPSKPTTAIFTADLTSLTVLELPNRVKTIADSTFAGNTTIQKVKIPASVTSIEYWAFTGCSALTTVEFTGNSGLTTIEEYAFGVPTGGGYAKCGIQEIVIPKGVTEIKAGAFYQCDALTSVKFGKEGETSSLQTIGNIAFRASSISSPTLGLKSIEIPKNVQSIGRYAFADQKNLATLTFEPGSKLKFIDESAFEACSKLNNVVFPASLETISKYAFRSARGVFATSYKASNMTNLSFETYTEETAGGDTSKIGKTSLSSIGEGAFGGTAFGSFTFPESTAAKIELGPKIFSCCGLLTEITISKSVISGIQEAFAEMPKLSTIVVLSGNSAYYGDDTVPIIYNTTKVTNPDGTISYTKGGSVMYIYGALEDGVSLEAGKFVVPAGAQQIGETAFMKQPALKEVYIPDTVTSIGRSAFLNCFHLEKVVFYKTTSSGNAYEPQLDEDGNYIPATIGQLQVIGAGAFGRCSALTSINLTEGLKEIQGFAFFETGFESFTIPSSVSKFTENVGGGNYKTTGLQFGFCTNLKTITFLTTMQQSDATMTADSYGMFSGCTALETVKFPENYKMIVQNMFKNCTALSCITYPQAGKTTPEKGVILPSAGLENIDASAFSGCSGLEYIDIPASVKTIGDKAFEKCFSLAKLTFAQNNKLETYNSSKKTGLNTIFGTTGLHGTTTNANYYGLYADLTIDMGSNDVLTALPNSLFYKMACIKGTIDLSGYTKLTYLGTKTFAGEAMTSATHVPAPRITAIKLPASLTQIGGSATTTVDVSNASSYLFQYNKTIEAIDLGGVVKISMYTFDGCSNLKYLGKGIEKIGEDGKAVLNEDGTVAYKTENVLTGVTLLGRDVFRNCSSLEKLSFPDLTTIATTASYYTATQGLFVGCSSLKSIEFGGSLPSNNVPKYLFVNLASLEKVVLPDSITTIDTYAFSGCSALTSITLPNGLTSLGTYAFNGCTGLISITLPNGLTSLSANTFRDCSSLETVILPTSLTAIEGSAFYNCSALSTLKMGELGEANVLTGVTSIGTFAFNACSSLVTMSLPNAASLGGTTSTDATNCVFQNCSSLESVVIADDVTSIGAWAFYGCSSLSSIKKVSGEANVLDGVTLIGKLAFYNSALESISLPDATTFGDSAFSNCKSLQTASIPSATKLGTNIFQSNEQLTSVTLSADLEKLSNSMFNGCSALTEITLPSGLTEIGEWVFNNCTSLATIKMEGGDNNVLTGVTKIGSVAFQYCNSLVTIALPDVEEVGDWLFSNCASLQTVTGLKVIGNMAFIGCTSLTSFTFDEATTAIGDRAFEGTGLTSVRISAGIAQIGDKAFANCQALESFEVAEGNEKFAATAAGVLVDKDGMLISWPGAKEALDLTGVTKIGPYAFNQNKKLTSIVIPTTVTEIDYYAFYDSAITAITFTDGADNASTLEKIGQGAFEGTQITEIILPASLTEIGAYAFKNTEALTSVTITGADDDTSKLTTIGESAFEGSAIASIALPRSVEEIDIAAFKDCASLTAVTFGYEGGKAPVLAAIGESAFENSALTSFVLPASATEIGANAFKNTTSLTAFTITGTVERTSKLATIKESAFEGSAVTAIALPASLTEIGASAFANTADLTTVQVIDGSSKDSKLNAIGASAFQESGVQVINLPESLKTIGANAFRGSGLTSVTLPGALKTIGTYAFAECSDLETVVLAEGITKLISSGTTEAQSVFRDSGITSLTLPSTMVSIPQYTFAFAGTAKPMTVTITDDAENDKASAMTTIGSYAFDGSGITAFKVPAAMTTINTYAFRNSASFTALTFAESAIAVTIGNYAFQGSGITSATISTRVSSVGEYAFQNCTSLKTLTFDAAEGNALELKKYSFQNTGLENLMFPQNSVTKLQEGAFADNELLATITFRSGAELTTFGTKMFMNCPAIQTADFGEDITLLGQKMFMGSTVGSVSFPYTIGKVVNATTGVVTYTMTQNSFEECTIDRVEIPEGITNLGSNVFLNANVRHVVLPSTLSNIGYSSFNGCSVETLEWRSLPTADEVIFGHSVFMNATNLREFIVYDNFNFAKQKNTFSGWTEEQTVYFVNRSEYDVILWADGTYATEVSQSSATEFWFSNAKCTFVWNYELPEED